MSTQAIESLSEDTVRRIADERDEPEWLLEARLKALEALETAELPRVSRCRSVSTVAITSRFDSPRCSGWTAT